MLKSRPTHARRVSRELVGIDFESVSLDMLAQGISLPDYRRFAELTPVVNLAYGCTWFMRWEDPELSPD